MPGSSPVDWISNLGGNIMTAAEHRVYSRVRETRKTLRDWHAHVRGGGIHGPLYIGRT
ncbi:hypothetical protein BO86DRAFT_91663 [Aspergillus japonicus CBS 114.51]|uniref:Uncharacterized protein n=1 Tax=Aspergillus japonicus CBS 114.51 TaxID=1448312 RepID=A0A8T8X1V5_ASPJA|nr:hypothetical protein BO86DRAFT_91663 [Aspergillus japonicus CBS 114.51]RAH82011.1 hypothetical protein BO86DRAFT_91663 [Aspergillus japonicus CBS 114.51]